jgi:hypothetical protein
MVRTPTRLLPRVRLQSSVGEERNCDYGSEKNSRLNDKANDVPMCNFFNIRLATIGFCTRYQYTSCS